MIVKVRYLDDFGNEKCTFAVETLLALGMTISSGDRRVFARLVPELATGTDLWCTKHTQLPTRFAFAAGPRCALSGTGYEVPPSVVRRVTGGIL